MDLFYLIAAFILSAGFIAGYKTGLVKLLTGVLITTVAACSSCYFFILLKPQFDSWFDFSAFINIALVIPFIFLLMLFLLTLAVKIFLPSFYIAGPKPAGRFLGAVTGTVLGAGVLITVITLTDLIKAPHLVADKLEASGITGLINTSAEAIACNLLVYEQNNKEIILAADNTTKDTKEEKSRSLPPFGAAYITRPDLEAEVLQLINNERTVAGLHILTADTQLVVVARKHCADMFTRGYFSHNTPEGKTPFDRLHTAKINYLYAGENLAFAATAVKAHKGLMLSAGHRANILSKNYHRAGIGVLENSLHGLLITQEFKD